MLAADAAALVVAFLLRHGPEDTSLELAARRSEVDVAADRGDVGQAQALAEVDKRLQLARLPVQPVEVVDQEAVDRPGFQVGQAARVLGAALAAPGADVVVDVALDDPPALALGQPLAILDLARYPETVSFTVGRDAGVHTSANGTRSHSQNIHLQGT